MTREGPPPPQGAPVSTPHVTNGNGERTSAVRHAVAMGGRPALGAVLGRPEVQARRAAAREAMRRSLAEHHRRQAVLDRLTVLHGTCAQGRDLSVVLDELRRLADEVAA